MALSDPFNSQGGTVQETGENMQQEDLSSQTNGSNQTFTVSVPFDSDSLRVYWNGIRQQINETITVQSITTFSTSFTPNTGDYIFIDFTPA